MDGEHKGLAGWVPHVWLERVHAQPEVRYNLSESRRKEIFRAIVAADRRAGADAERMYPDLDPLRPGYCQGAGSA